MTAQDQIVMNAETLGETRRAKLQNIKLMAQGIVDCTNDAVNRINIATALSELAGLMLDDERQG